MLSMFFISLCFMALYENALNQTGFKCGKPTKQTASLLISCGLMIILTSYMGLLLFRKISGYTRTRVKQRRRLRSGYWTRRRIYWRRRNISRTEYIAEALQGSIKQRIYCLSESQERQEEMFTKPCSDTLMRNGLAVSGVQSDGEVHDMNEVILNQKMIRCSSSEGKRQLKKRGGTSTKRLSFIVNLRSKPVKKQRGFRRRTGRPSKSYPVDGHGHSKRESMAKSLSRRKQKRKKKCKVMPQAASQQPSVSSINDGHAPKYHLSFKQVLQAYKTLRKGRGFHASKKVLWKNRHTLFRSKNFNKLGRFESYRMREKEYDITEPPDEEEAPQLLETGPRYSSDEAGDGPLEDPLCQGMGPEYSSDEAGDGPDSSEEYVPLDRKAKRRLIQRQYDRKRKKLRSKAKQFSRNANPTVRARHNASAHTARDTSASKRARASKLEHLARERDPQVKERHNASANTARDTNASKRARDSKLEKLARERDPQKKERHNVSNNTARDTSASKRARDSKLERLARKRDPQKKERHNKSAHTARDASASKRARQSKLKRLARERDPLKKARHNASAHTARDASSSQRARDSKVERFACDYDLWSSDALPEDDLIKQFELNPYVAAAAFRMMGGVPEDARICPTDMSFKVDVENMINRWKAEVGHDVDIRVCGACNARDIMTEGEYRQIPITHNYLKICILKEELPSKVFRDGKHIVRHNNIDYKINPEAFIAQSALVTLCLVCFIDLKSAFQFKKEAPKHTIAYWDLGRVPSYVPKLNAAELIAIAKVVVFTPLFELKAVHGARSTGLRGHVVALPLNSTESLDSVVESLPRRDLAKRVKLCILGNKSTWKIAKNIARRGPLSIKLEPMLLFLQWLKEIKSPEYVDVSIPHSKVEISAAKEMLEKAVEQILRNASCSSSGLISKMFDHQRSIVEEDKENIEDDFEGISTRNILLLQPPKTLEPMTAALQSLQDKLEQSYEEDDGPMEVRIEDRLVNEYTSNNRLLAGAFPHIFPFGLPSEKFSGPIPKKVVRTWFLYYDRRCSREVRLLWLLFDQKVRHASNLGCSLRIKSKGKREKAFSEVAAQDDFSGKLAEAIANPKSSESIALKKLIKPLVKIVGSKVDWTPLQRSGTVGRLYALNQFFNLSTWFITISPAMRNSKLALRMTLRTDVEDFQLPQAHTRSRMMAADPIAAARVFYRIIKKFFDIIVRLPLNDFTGKRINVDRLLEKNREKYIGAYGFATAAYAVTENQEGGSLHAHGHIHGTWDIDVIQNWIHKDDFRKQMIDLLDSIVTCTIPDDIKTAPKPNPYPVLASEPYPDASDVHVDAARVNSMVNHHHHTFTCWKHPSCPTCRVAYKRQLAKEGYFADIHADPTVKNAVVPVRRMPGSRPGREIISNPPARCRGNPFELDDERVIVHGHRRRDEFEQMQVEAVPIASSLLRCNTSMQPIVAPVSGKASVFYSAKYCAKNPYKLHCALPLMMQANEEYNKYGSRAEDSGTSIRKATNILQKTLNKSGYLEVADQQAAAAVLGYDSFFSSHKFTFCFIWDARAQWLSLQHSSSYDAAVDDTDDDVEQDGVLNIEVDDSGKLIGLSQFKMYLLRGPKLEYLPLYDYSGCIRLHREKKSIAGRKQRRPTSNRFAFDKDDGLPTKFTQIISSCPAIPQLAGAPPPGYPKPPSEDIDDEQQWALWLRKAKVFVEFYSLLFLPFTKTWGPLDPTQPELEILPWSGKVSWDNFWKVFGSFDIDTNNLKTRKWYKRSTWRIFKNVVENLRVKAGARSLAAKWRAMAADKRSEVDNVSKVRSSISNEIPDNEDDESYDQDDLALIAELLRAKHGADIRLSRSEQEAKKADDYLQMTKEHLVSTFEANVGEEKEPIKRDFKTFTYEDCFTLNPTIAQEILEDIGDESKLSEVGGEKIDKFDLESEERVNLTGNQDDVVKKMKSIIADGQMMAFLQGVPGAGKTTTAKELAIELGLKVIFSGTTSTAAALFKSVTINSLLKLGLSVNNFTYTSISYAKKQDILDNLRGIQLLAIDEASMMTPVTLARIDLHLRLSLESDLPFGGLHLLLIGDFFQFPPVAPGLAKPSLYQAAVLCARGLRLPNEAYRTGAHLFTKFKLLILNEQVRADEKYDGWLSNLRDTNVEYPITDDWLSKIKVLSSGDRKEDLKWDFAPIAVTGNPERRLINDYKAKLFGKKNGEPILRWTCKVKQGTVSGKPVFGNLDVSVVGRIDELVRHFVRGAPCVLSETIETKLNLAKGTVGELLGVAWKDDTIAFDNLHAGQVVDVQQPDFIIVRIDDRTIAIKGGSARMKVSKERSITFLQHGCDLLFAITYHKTQGATMDALVLSICPYAGLSKKIFPLSITSLYVGASRVHKMKELRVLLPLTAVAHQNIKKLRRDPLLAQFFNNFDSNGCWKPDGFKEYQETICRESKLDLGLVDKLEDLVKDEVRIFYRRLDLIFDAKANLTTLLEGLREYHNEGRNLLLANSSKVLHSKRRKLKTKMVKEGLGTMQLARLRYFAKRLGIPGSRRASRIILRKALGNILFDGDIVLDQQRVPVNLSPTGLNKVKRKHCKPFASDDQRLEESVGVSGRERRVSRAPKRSKRLREKSLGEVSHSVFDGDIVPSNQQRVPANLGPTGLLKVKGKQCKPYASDDRRLEESVSVSRAQWRVSRPPRRSKRLREKPSGEASHSGSKNKTTSNTNSNGNNNRVFGDFSLLQQALRRQHEKSHTSDEKTDIQYVPKLVVIPNYPPMYTMYNPGEGNCFFYALQQGLEKLGITFLNEEDIRENLAAWFQVETNQMQMEAHIGGPPSSFIGQLRDTGLYTPAVGWESYLAGKSWGWWGEHVRQRGTWVGALEVPIINQMMDNAGLDVVVNIYDERYGRIWGNENNGTKLIIMLYLSPGHFELLQEEPSSRIDDMPL